MRGELGSIDGVFSIWRIDGVFSDMRIEEKGKSLRESQTSGQSLFCDRDQPEVQSETNTACEIFMH